MIVQDEAEAREQEAIDHFQWAVKVFKFKKYKKGYEGEKRGASPRYPLEIGAFLRNQDQEPPESGDVPAIVVETSLSVLSNIFAPLVTSPQSECLRVCIVVFFFCRS